MSSQLPINYNFNSYLGTLQSQGMTSTQQAQLLPPSVAAGYNQEPAHMYVSLNSFLANPLPLSGVIDSFGNTITQYNQFGYNTSFSDTNANPGTGTLTFTPTSTYSTTPQNGSYSPSLVAALVLQNALSHYSPGAPLYDSTHPNATLNEFLHSTALSDAYAAVTGDFITSTQISAIYSGLLEDFASSEGIVGLNLPSSSTYNPNISLGTITGSGGDWSPLLQSGAITSDVFTNPSSASNPLALAFANFAKNYVYPPSNSGYVPYRDNSSSGGVVQYTGPITDTNYGGYLVGNFGGTSSQDLTYLAPTGGLLELSHGTYPNDNFINISSGVLQANIISTYHGQFQFNAPIGRGLMQDSYLVSFLGQFHKSLLADATIGNASDPSTVPPDATAPFANLASYENYYAAVSSTASPPFQTALKSFYQHEVSTQGSGFFTTSGSFGDFIKYVNDPANNLSLTNLGYTQFGNSLITGTDSVKAQVLNRIMALLIKVINALQNVGIAQANELNYLTQYQNAYTALLQQIPTYLANGTAPIGTPETKGNGTQAATDRNDINSSLNGIFGDNLRALQNVQQNNAKTVQSNINTTNDDVNQQTDMATTLLQQMSQLLGSIFR